MNNKEQIITDQLNSIEEVDLFDQIIEHLESDHIKNNDLYNIMDQLYIDHYLDYYLDNTCLNFEDLYDKITSVYFKDPSDSFIDEVLYNLIYDNTNNYIVEDIKELNKLFNEQVHYKINGGYGGALYYYGYFDININSDSYIIVDHNKRIIKSLDLYNNSELIDFLRRLFNTIVYNMDSMDLMDLINIVNDNDPYIILTNSYNNKLKISNGSEDILNRLSNYDKFIYYDLNYEHKIKTIKESDLKDYLDMDYLINMFINEEAALIDFLWSLY